MNTSTQPRFQLLQIDQIELDLRNPRIARWIEQYGENPTAEQIALALGAGSGEEENTGPNFTALKQSIRTNKGIIHPILVNKQIDGKLVVIEGNTRTQIYREFKNLGVEGDWETIPAMVYENLNDEVIDSIRLQAHLVGVRQWDPYSKAKYLNQLYNKQHLSFSQIVDYCGGDKREVTNYIHAYNDMEQYYTPILESDQDFDPTRFSAFIELQNPRRQEALLKAGYTKSDFAKWVHERKLYPLATVRKLPRILQNDKSHKIFLKSGAEEALLALAAPPSEAALKDANIQQLARELYNRIREFRYEDLERLREDRDSEDVEILIDARDALTDFCADIVSADER